MEILNLVLITVCILSILANCLMAHRYGIVKKVVRRLKFLPPKEYQEYMTSPYIGFTSFFRAVKYPHLVDICIVGDSMTERGDLRYFFPDKTVVSQGIGGDTTRGMLNRLDCVIRCSPKIIVLQVGINDLLQNISIDNIMTNIGKIVSQLSNCLANSHIFIESVYPITRSLENYSVYGINKNDVLKLNKKIQEYVGLRGGIYSMLIFLKCSLTMMGIFQRKLRVIQFI